jgi:acetyl esterase
VLHPVALHQNTDGYREVPLEPHLTADTMAWFWDAYLPDSAARSEATASPPRGSLEDLGEAL